MLEIKARLEPTKKSNYKSLHLANLDRKYLGNNNKNTKILNIKHITPINDLSISECITSIQSRLGI